MSHIPSADVIDPATSSASMDDQVTSPCFLDAQDMSDTLNVKIQPVIDVLSFTSLA